MAGVVHYQGYWKVPTSKSVLINSGAEKAREPAIPLCMAWGYTLKYGTMTTDKSKVTCSRCAKALGITPAAREVSGSPTGTCQCCFGEFKSPDGKKLSLHGYKRPGTGSIYGRCRGQGKPPYEVSCEETKKWLAELKEFKEEGRKYLKDLAAGKVKTLTAYVGTGVRRGPWPGREVNEAVQVQFGDEEKKNPFKPGSYSVIPSYDDLRDTEVRRMNGVIRQVTEDIEFVGGKVATWKKVPWPK